MIFARKCNHLFMIFYYYIFSYFFDLTYFCFLYQNLSNENCFFFFYINDTWYRKYNQWMNTKLISCCLQPSVSLSSSHDDGVMGTFNCNSNKTQDNCLYINDFIILIFFIFPIWCSKTCHDRNIWSLIDNTRTLEKYD